MTARVPGRAPGWAVCCAWGLLAAAEVWVVLGAPGEAPWGRVAGEVAICAGLGALLWAGLPSFPAVALLAPAALGVFVALLAQASGAVHVVGAAALALGPLALVARRQVPPVLGPVLAPLAVLARLYADVHGGASGTSSSDLGRIVDALARPLHRPSFGGSAGVGPDVVVISLDALRADDARRMTTWKRLAARGAAWDRATSGSSWTMPSLASLQTGLPPDVHGATCIPGARCQGLQPDVVTLAERLRARGYATGAVTANTWASPTNGFERGFDAFVDLGNSSPTELLFVGLLSPPRVHRQSAEVAVAEALRLLARMRDRSFYLWVHLLEPHMPYRHAEDPALRAVTAETLRDLQLPDAGQVAGLRAAYRSEIEHADRQLGRLLDALEAEGVLDSGVVVLTSDHGEEFWEHGGVEHGHSHHGEVVDVPLVLVAPGVPPGERTDPASTVDVAPTVAAIVGLELAGADLREVQPDGRIVTSVGNLHGWMQCSARDTRTRAIVDDCGGSRLVRRYDLLADPLERQVLAPDPADPVQERALAVELPAAGVAADQNVEALRALGYVQ